MIVSEQSLAEGVDFSRGQMAEPLGKPITSGARGRPGDRGPVACQRDLDEASVGGIYLLGDQAFRLELAQEGGHGGDAHVLGGRRLQWPPG